MKKILTICITLILISSCTNSDEIKNDVIITTEEKIIETNETIISTDDVIDIQKLENQPNY